MNTKRIIICTIGGIVAGIICMIGGYLRGFITEISILGLLPFFFNRIVLGFVIGISNLKLHYLLNGVVIGLVISLISAFVAIENNIFAFIAFTVAGMIYGALIDWTATKLCKCPVSP
jgi:hypothetical protein